MGSKQFPLMLQIQIFYSLYTSTFMSQSYNSSSGTLKSMVTKQVPLEHILLDWEDEYTPNTPQLCWNHIAPP
uniref:Uncharacterized protein n=1 Tax=Populus trichocarpa TaxID=3694 RepID=A0A3N7FXA9_POPTR